MSISQNFHQELVLFFQKHRIYLLAYATYLSPQRSYSCFVMIFFTSTDQGRVGKRGLDGWSRLVWETMYTSKHNGTSPDLHATGLVVAILCYQCWISSDLPPAKHYYRCQYLEGNIVSGPELVQSTFISCKVVVASHGRPFSNISLLNLHWHGSSVPVLVIL